jgi:hypothetical protein
LASRQTASGYDPRASRFCKIQRVWTPGDVVEIDPISLAEYFDPDLLGGTSAITAKSLDSTPLVFTPCYLWGNRGPSQMTVWARA